MADLFGEDTSLELQIKCVEREIGMRKRVYPNWVKVRKMSAEKAEYEIKVMESVLNSLKKLNKAKWWLNEIVNNHRFTPISTAEMAIKDLENTNTDIVFYDKDKKIDGLTYIQRKAEYELQKIKKEMQDD